MQPRSRALENPKSVDLLFNSSELEANLQDSITAYVSKRENISFYLDLFNRHSQKIVRGINVLAALLVNQLGLNDLVDKIHFRFTDTVGANISSDGGGYLIGLSVQDAILSASPSGYPFAVLARAMAHEFFHIYLGRRYERRNLQAGLANELKSKYGNTTLYDKDLIEISCELYAIKFMRQLASLEDSSRQDGLLQLADEVEATVDARVKLRLNKDEDTLEAA